MYCIYSTNNLRVSKRRTNQAAGIMQHASQAKNVTEVTIIATIIITLFPKLLAAAAIVDTGLIASEQ